MPTRKKIVIDTDFGTDVDDALALALALASPEIEIVSIFTVAR
jgi:purine nucleosidase